MWLRHLPRSRQRGQAAPHLGTRKGVEAGDEQMKDLTLGPPKAPPNERPDPRPPQFRCLGQLYLLGYTRDEDVRLVYLEAVGPHENFYRDLKR